MTSEFRKDLLELLIVIAIAAVAFFFATQNAHAQKYNTGITLDMLVQRTTVCDSTNEKQSLSHPHINTITLERVRLNYPNKDIIELYTNTDTLICEMISIFEHTYYIDKNSGRKYIITRDKMSKQRSFYYTFTPHSPYDRNDLYTIHISPFLPFSKN